LGNGLLGRPTLRRSMSIDGRQMGQRKNAQQGIRDLRIFIVFQTSLREEHGFRGKHAMKRPDGVTRIPAHGSPPLGANL
jgi:hypothetical protein